ncbi:MAG: hypothetical protein R3E97_23125 [Candidatus Eisenbacteria bacterium]
MKSIHLLAILLPVLGLAALTTGSAASEPSPDASTIEPADALGSLFVTPSRPAIDPGTRNVLTLVGVDGDILADVPVKIVFESDAICVCSDAVLTGRTNADGQFEFITAAGGYSGTPGSALVVADTVILREFAVKSPDNDGASGDCVVRLPDLVALSACLERPCIEQWDFDNDGVFGLGDLILYGRSFASQQHCN